ncbi:GNAT family N-acetyltransferase [Actinomycetota bacterium]
MFTTRPTEPDDLALLLNWTATPYDLALWAGSTLTWPLTLAALGDMLATGPDAGRASWTVTRPASDEPVGHFSLTLTDQGATVRIGRILLDPGLRGRGLGRELIEIAFAGADATGATTQTLGVLRRNEHAARIYEELGFEPTGETTIVSVGGECWTSLEMVRRREV